VLIISNGSHLMSTHEHFRLSRMSDDLVYEFDRMKHADGSFGYRRRDQELWITFKAGLGWVGYDEAHGGITLRPWNVSPAEQSNYPPEGEWVSKKGVKSYVYELQYVVNT
jgi:hypothetical protein